jgi:hypothetical protein
VRERLRAAWPESLATSIAVVPVVVAFVRSVVTHWMPMGDNALVEMRARDVFTVDHFPLLGTWSSASLAAGKDLNHPGPLLFDLLATPVRVFGGAVGVALGVALINAAAIVCVAVVARRVGGRDVALAATAVAATLAWTLGSELLIDPWNPHVLILPCLALLVLGWGVAAGDVVLLPWLLFVGTLCLQTHVGYAYLVPAVVVGSTVGAAVVLRRRWRQDPATRAGDVRRVGRAGVLSLGVVVVTWAQPIWEQLFGRGEGNISRLLSSTGGDEPTVGAGLGVRILATVVALPPWWGRPGFMDSVPYTPYSDDGSVSPDGMIGTGAAALALIVLIGVLAAIGFVAWRRRDRPVVTACALAVGLLLVAIATLTVMPIGVLGLTSHQMRWIWSLGAFVAIAIVVGLVRAVRQDASRWVLLGITAVVAVLALPAHVHLAGPSSAPEAKPIARELARQVDEWDPGEPVLFDTSGLRFAEPYSTVVMSVLQRNGIDFVLSEEGLVRQLGEGRRYEPGEATIRVHQVEGHAALTIPDGKSRIAFASPLSPAEIGELLDLEAQIVEHIETIGLLLTPEGYDLVEGGALGVTLEQIDGADEVAQALVDDAAIMRLTQADALVLPPEVVDVFTRAAELRAEVSITTVAILAERLPA